MRFLSIFILAMLVFSSPGLAQDQDIGASTSALQDVLINLKQSVEKLSLDNDQLSQRDQAMQTHVAELQAQLKTVQSQGALLDSSASQLRGHNPRRAVEISRLEKQNYDLDDQIQKDEIALKNIQESMEPGYQEDQRLLLQLKALNNNLAAPVSLPLPAPADEHDQKERLKLMKMIYDSQERQERLHQAIADAQKNAPMLPAVTALAHQELLKEQIKDLESQLAALPPDKPTTSYGFADQWNDNQLRQLEDDLKALERNYLQLKELMAAMTKKSQNGRMSADQHVEEQKLQNNIDDLKRQGISLRVDLDELRSQMVDLDKRKSHLEDMIKQLP